MPTPPSGVSRRDRQGESRLGAGDWLIVETLMPGAEHTAERTAEHTAEHTVVADGARPRSWSSVARARSAYGPAASTRIGAVVEACAQTGSTMTEVVSGRRGSTANRIFGIPVLGAFGAVHGVHVWIGPEAAMPPEHRTAAAWEWNSRTMLAHHGPGIEGDILGIDVASQRDTRASTDFFRHVERFDGRLEYLAIASQLTIGARWDGNITIRQATGGLRELHMIAQVVDVDGVPVVRGLVHDITDVVAPAPLRDAAALRVMAAQGNPGVGMILLTNAHLYEWLSDPTPPLDRWVAELPEYAANGDAETRAACQRIIAGSPTEELSIRVRFADTDWIDVAVVLTAVLGGSAPHALIRVTPVN